MKQIGAGSPVDPLYPLLERFTKENSAALPTVNLDEGELGELRRLLLEWDAGKPVEGVIVELFSIPPEASS